MKMNQGLWALLITSVLIGYTPVRSQGQDDPKSSSLGAAGRAFVDLLVKRDFATAVEQFDNTMKAALPQEKLQETWDAVNTQAGAFNKQVSTRLQEQGNYTIVVVTCEFDKAKLDVRVVFDKSPQIAGLFFAPAAPPAAYTPPSYVVPNAFREKEVIVGTGEWALPGTLALPTGRGPFPVVVLVHGSGPHDRDETIGPNKPFRDLAWGLASKRIAVLRYEKRTKQHAAKFGSVAAKFTVKEETIDDVIAAVDLLRKTENIDAARVFVLGHSLGGMLIPKIGKLDPKIAGFIALAGATRQLEDVILEQMNYIFSLDGTVSQEEQAQLEEVKRQVAIVKNLKPSEAESSTFVFGAPAAYWLDLRGYDPPETAKALKQPMLILQGERDYQVTMDDFQRWNALSSNRNVTFKSYANLNHLFVAGKNRSTPAEYELSGNMAEETINDIANWIKLVKVMESSR